jgi:hypothetical protein
MIRLRVALGMSWRRSERVVSWGRISRGPPAPGSETAGIQWTLTYSPSDAVSKSAAAGPTRRRAGKSVSCADLLVYRGIRRSACQGGFCTGHTRSVDQDGVSRLRRPAGTRFARRP